jgi:peptide methionine sulfoxide reductase msrA/msrB
MDQKNPSLDTATFAGGCFWCIESDFEKCAGVHETITGYTGGHKSNPTYQEVSSGRSGHVEAVRVSFNPDQISYDDLLKIFWEHVDPTDAGGQFVDRGAQYRTAIYYHDDSQKRLAERSMQLLARSGRFNQPIVTEILPAVKFYPAEAYHQDYYKQNPVHYKFYRHNSGRDQFFKKVWASADGNGDLNE